MHKLIIAAAVPTALLAAAGCGSNGSSPAAGGPPSSEPATTVSGTSTTAVDPCLVGTWRSTSATGTIGNGNLHITLTGGGSGAVVVIRSDGAVGESFDSMQPISGTGSDHNSYTLAFSGAVQGQLQAANGQSQLRLLNPDKETVTVSQGTKVLATSHPAATGPSTYSCSSGQSLAVTSGGVTFHWDRASS